MRKTLLFFAILAACMSLYAQGNQGQIQKRPVVEVFASQYCPFDPAAHQRIAQAIADYGSQVIWVTHHVGYINDGFTIGASQSLTSLYGDGSTYCPAMMIDRNYGLAQIEGSNPGPVFWPDSAASIRKRLDTAYSNPPLVSCEIGDISNALACQTLSVTVFGSIIADTMLDNIRLALYLVEDSVNGMQHGSSDYYHRNVIRASVSDIWGDEITLVGNSFSKSYMVTIPEGCNVVNCHLVAFVCTYGSSINERTILNSTKEPLASLSTSQFMLNVISSDESMGEVIGGGYAYCQSVIAAEPYDCYDFIAWNDGVTDNPRTVVVDQDTSFTAYFAHRQDEYVITATVNDSMMGSVAGIGSYGCGDTVAVQALPNSHYHFVGWMGLDDTINPMVFAFTESSSRNVVLHALFAPNVYDVFTNSLGGGKYTYNTTAQLAALPQVGMQFEGWSDGVVDNPRNVIVESDTTIDALFAPFEIMTVYDTIVVYDTVIYNHYYFDTTSVTHYVFDSTWVFDTVYLVDTIHLHDTVYVEVQGIDGAEAANAKVYTEGGRIVVEGAEGLAVGLYDVNGRRLEVADRWHSPKVSFEAPGSGAYLLRIGGGIVKKVVVVR